jgi:hypothetical protein
LLLLELLLLLFRQRLTRGLRQLELRLATGDPNCNGRNKRRHHRAGEQKLADLAHDFSPSPKTQVPTIGIKADRAQMFRGPDGGHMARA